MAPPGDSALSGAGLRGGFPASFRAGLSCKGNLARQLGRDFRDLFVMGDPISSEFRALTVQPSIFPATAALFILTLGRFIGSNLHIKFSYEHFLGIDRGIISLNRYNFNILRYIVTGGFFLGVKTLAE